VNGDAIIISSSMEGLRFDQNETKFTPTLSQNKNSMNSIIIDKSIKFQSIVGFGNAFTGAVSQNLDLLPKDLQHKIYQSYFSKEKGIAFNILRIPIGGCDFDSHPWAYNETPKKDVNLSNFTHLYEQDIKKVKQIKDLMQVTDSEDLKLFGAAWSPPPWMKTNNDWTGVGSLRYEYFQTWALYHVRYLQLMKQQGLNYWAISTGNEPLNGNIGGKVVRFLSLGWTPTPQGRWVANNLGPLLKKAFPDVKIISCEDQCPVFSIWFDIMYNAYPASKDYIYGHGVHWYWNWVMNSKYLVESHKKYPDKVILATEAVNGAMPWMFNGPILGDWKRAENYILDIFQNLNNYVSAWIEWNMILDQIGGPNYLGKGSYVDSPIIINDTSRTEFYKQPMFYAIGHFSRFILPNSVRIGISSEWSNKLFATAFLRPDNLTTLVTYN
jgi:glucosylceramidase